MLIIAGVSKMFKTSVAPNYVKMKLSLSALLNVRHLCQLKIPIITLHRCLICEASVKLIVKEQVWYSQNFIHSVFGYGVHYC